MTTRTPTAPPHSAPTAARPRLTPLPDPPRDPDMATQLPHTARIHTVLADWFRQRPDVLVSGEGYLCRAPGEARRSPHPDCLVALNLSIPPLEIELSNGYTISEVGKPPDFVLEVASESTGLRDYTIKREQYANLGVVEYWRFDRTGGEFHDAALAGDLLTENGRYEPMPLSEQSDGSIRGYSPALRLELRWESNWLYFWDPATRAYLPDLTEAKAQRDAVSHLRDVAVRRANAEAAARHIAEERVDSETTARRMAEQLVNAETVARQRAEERANAEAAARHIAEERVDSETTARRMAEQLVNAETVARQRAEEQANAEAAARRIAEERVRQLEAELQRRHPQN